VSSIKDVSSIEDVSSIKDGADRTEIQITVLAQAVGLALRPEHMAEVCVAWRGMQPHLARVLQAELAVTEEPASLFRP
jgi:hypothetical protein